IKIDSTAKCTSWHICVRDTSKTDPGIRAVMLIDDPDGVYFEPGAKALNVNFDTTASGYERGELHPRTNPLVDYCFDVNVSNALSAATAPIAVIDNRGNALYFKLDYKSPAIALATVPPSARADSIV